MSDFCVIKGVSIINSLSIINSKNSGINIFSNYNSIENCYICNNNLNGIYLAPNTSHNLIGSNPSLNSNYVSNILANNGSTGITIDGSNYNLIQKIFTRYCFNDIS